MNLNINWGILFFSDIVFSSPLQISMEFSHELKLECELWHAYTSQIYICFHPNQKQTLTILIDFSTISSFFPGAIHLRVYLGFFQMPFSSWSVEHCSLCQLAMRSCFRGSVYQTTGYSGSCHSDKRPCPVHRRRPTLMKFSTDC